MPPNLDQFIKFTDATNRFNVSMTTLRRKRDKARDTKDTDTYSHFLVKTSDGQTFSQPLPDLVNNLVRDGMQPEWFVELSWISSQFSGRTTMDTLEQSSNTPKDTSPPITKEQPSDNTEQPEQPTEHPRLSPSVQAIIDAYESQVVDLKRRLDDARNERTEIRKDNHELLSRLTKLLPEGQHADSEKGTTTPVVDTTPKIQPVKTRPKPNAKKPKLQKQPSTTSVKPKQRGFLGRLWYGSNQ